MEGWLHDLSVTSDLNEILEAQSSSAVFRQLAVGNSTAVERADKRCGWSKDVHLGFRGPDEATCCKTGHVRSVGL